MLSLKVLEEQIRVGLRCYHIALADIVLFSKEPLFNAFYKEVKYLCTFEMYRENLFQYFCTVKSFNFFPFSSYVIQKDWKVEEQNLWRLER